jgi:predicted nucleic-acid-binding protein
MGRPQVKITADTNLLVRIIANDDAEQARIAGDLLGGANLVAISLPCLCEFAWVMDKVYRLSRADIAIAIRKIVERANVSADQAAVATGVQILASGGDFADGVIAVASAELGGETFISFDRKAVARLNAIGLPAQNAYDFK